MSLIIQYLSSEDAQRNDPGIQKTISLSKGVQGQVFQIVVTVEAEPDRKALEMLIDLIVGSYSGLLPDYRQLVTPFHQNVSIMVTILYHYVSVYVQEVDKEIKGYSFGYEVGKEFRRALPAFERDNTFQGLVN